MENKLEWKTEKRKVGDLKFFEGNPRQMDKKQAGDLMQSLRRFDLVEIPAIDQNNRIIAGNMRINALISLGRGNEEIEVRVPSRPLSEEEAREYLLRSNKNLGQWDFGLLANFDQDLLTEVGFEDWELEKFIINADKDLPDLLKQDGSEALRIEMTLSLTMEQRKEVLEAIRKTGLADNSLAIYVICQRFNQTAADKTEDGGDVGV